MDLKYWKCPQGHVSVQNVGSSTCYCNKCGKEYRWSQGREVSDPNPPKDTKQYPYE